MENKIVDKVPQEVRVVESWAPERGFDIQYGDTNGRFGNWTVIATIVEEKQAVRTGELLARTFGSKFHGLVK